MIVWEARDQINPSIFFALSVSCMEGVDTYDNNFLLYITLGIKVVIVYLNHAV